jgi:hypothetical protein
MKTSVYAGYGVLLLGLAPAMPACGGKQDDAIGASLSGGTASTSAGTGATHAATVGGRTGMGDTSTSPACICPSTPIQWGPDGGDKVQNHTRIDCDTFSRIPQNGSAGYQCSIALQCTNWRAELTALATALALPDVQQAFAQSPSVFGNDLRPVDGIATVVSMGGKSIAVGEPCYKNECEAAKAGTTIMGYSACP